MRVDLIGNSEFQVSNITPAEFELIRQFFTYKVSQKEWDWKAKKWNFHAKKIEINSFTLVDASTVRFGQGFIFAFCNIFYHNLDPANVAEIVPNFKNYDFKITNYYDLEDRDGTYSKLDTLLSHTKGILQIPTGSGKTEIIATITRNVVDNLDHILIISETTPVLDEIRSRLTKLGVNVPGYFDKDNLINVIKPSGFCRHGLYNEEAIRDYFSKVKFILADEVETTVTPSFIKLFENMPSVKYMWGFSASANKNKATGIPKNGTIKDVLNENTTGVIAYYGFTAVDDRPKDFDINIYTVWSDVRVHPDIQQRQEVIRRVFSSQAFRKTLRSIVNEGETLFVPVNIKGAFYDIINDPMFAHFRIMMISGDGYVMYHNGNAVSMDIEECKYRIANKECQFVFGTSSSYRGIDFHGIDSILLTFEAQSGILRQCIGRLTRQQHFNIYLLRPKEKIAFLTSAFWNMYKEIKQYYSNCRLKFSSINGYH